MSNETRIRALGRHFAKLPGGNEMIDRAVFADDPEILYREAFELMSRAKVSDLAGMTIGEQFTSSAAYKAVAGKHGQRHAQSEFIYHPNLLRATATTSGMGLTSIQKLSEIVLIGQQPLLVGNLIPQTPTSNSTVRYLSENSFTNAADAVGEGGEKPEASWDLAEVDAQVRKIAVTARVTDEFFADFAGTRDYINNRLTYSVGAKEDNMLLNGAGNATEIKGILNFAGIQTQPLGANTVPDAIFKAITKVRTGSFLEADAVVINPSDFKNVALMKDNAGQYYFGGPSGGAYGGPANGGKPMIWNKPVILTTFIARGTALVGAFGTGAQIFRRQTMTVDATNSDGNDFQYNRIAIRAETRLALAVFRPLAFCEVTGIPIID